MSIELEMQRCRLGIRRTGLEEQPRGIQNRSEVESPLVYYSCAHVGPSCQTRAVPALYARPGPCLSSTRVALADAP
jgi:hypothetical protein